MRQELYATTPFPNHLLDKTMPSLKDTEWRVLCVIVRQTLGWRSKDGKHRKTSDWITQAQLVKKTGRDRAALSRAVNVLVQGKYIEVRNYRGDLLQSATERRQCKGRLFYGLRDKSEYRTLGPNSLLVQEEYKSEYRRASKANTTKETLTKENATKGFSQNSLVRLAANVFPRETVEVDATSTQGSLRHQELECSEAVKSFVTLFEQLHQRAKNHKTDVYLATGKVERLEQLLASHPSLDWTPILQAFFASDASYIVRRNHSLSAFLDSCHIFLMQHIPARTR